MSLLEQIVAALENHKSATLYITYTDNGQPGGELQQMVNLYVYPREGLYTAEALNDFLENLLPGTSSIQPGATQAHEMNEELTFGYLTFDEDIGTRKSRVELELTDPTLFGARGFDKTGKQVIETTTTLKRRIFVRLFPDRRVAELVFRPSGVEPGNRPQGVSSRGISRVMLDKLLADSP